MYIIKLETIILFWVHNLIFSEHMSFWWLLWIQALPDAAQI